VKERAGAVNKAHRRADRGTAIEPGQDNVQGAFSGRSKIAARYIRLEKVTFKNAVNVRHEEVNRDGGFRPSKLKA
jgi:hypothetical protein